MNSAAKSPILPILCGCVTFIAAIQVSAIAMSLAHITISVLAADIMLLIAGMAGYVQGRITNDSIDTANPPGGGNIYSSKVFIFLITISLAVYILLWISAYIRWDLTCDGNTYHIPAIQLWAQKGYIHWVDPNFECSRFINGYPKGAETVSYILVRAFGNTHLVNTANLIFLPLGVLGVWSIASVLGAGQVISAAAGMAYILIPVNINQSATTYVDSSYGSCVIVLIAIILYFYIAVISKTAIWQAIIVPLGCAAGLVLAVKSSGILILAVGLAVLICSILARSISEPQLIRRRIGVAAGLSGSVLIAAAVGGYWYIRNYYYTGSPLYPAELRIFGHEIFPGMPIADVMSIQANTPDMMRYWSAPMRIIGSWLQFAWVWPSSIIQPDSRMGGLGFLWLAGCLPAILLSLYAAVRGVRIRQVSGLIFMLLAIVGLTFVFSPMNWWARYTVWLYSLGLPCIAWTAQTIFSGKTKIGRIWLLICGILLFADASVCVYIAVSETRLPAALGFGEMQGTVLDKIFESNESVAIGSLTGQLPDGRWKQELAGRLSIPVGARKILALSKAADVNEIKQLANQNVRWLIWDDSVPAGRLSAVLKNAKIVPGFLIVEIKPEIMSTGKTDLVRPQ